MTGVAALYCRVCSSLGTRLVVSVFPSARRRVAEHKGKQAHEALMLRARRGRRPGKDAGSSPRMRASPGMVSPQGVPTICRSSTGLKALWNLPPPCVTVRCSCRGGLGRRTDSVGPKSSSPASPAVALGTGLHLVCEDLMRTGDQQLPWRGRETHSLDLNLGSDCPGVTSCLACPDPEGFPGCGTRVLKPGPAPANRDSWPPHDHIPGEVTTPRSLSFRTQRWE